jgi:hypothetical protein
MGTSLQLDLHYKQGLALQSTATEILYGGAAGGGKSHLMRVAAIAWCWEIPGLQVYLFRRLSVDLEKNHLEGPQGFRNLLAPLINKGMAEIVEGEIRFYNGPNRAVGSKIYLCHCKDAKDRFKYQGSEIHVLLIDELTHFTEEIYRYLRGRVRAIGLKLPEKYKGLFPRIICGSNPGNLGHAWVKRTFIESAGQYEIVVTPKDEGGMKRQYIPALLEDNPSLLTDDPEYEIRLMGLGSPELVKAMRYGLWDITAGAALEKLSRAMHLLRPFKVPQAWTKFTSIDWGTARPFSIGWYCIADDDTELKAKDHWPTRYIPKGAVIRYREWYGWNGKPNEGCRMESPAVAKRTLEIEEEFGEEMDYRIGDSAMWAEHDGPSVQERMYDSTDGRYSMGQSRKDRISNYEEIRTRIAGEDGIPMLYVTENCKHFWRTVPDLQLDELHPEKGPDSEQEDHVYDDLAYACASRPWITTESDRKRAAYEEAKERHGGRHKKFY